MWFSCLCFDKISNEKNINNNFVTNIDEEKIEKLYQLDSEYITSKIIEIIFLIDKFFILNYSVNNKHNILNYSYIDNNINIPKELKEVITEFLILTEQLNKMSEYLFFLVKKGKYTNNLFSVFIKENFKIKTLSSFKKFLEDYFENISILNKKEKKILKNLTNFVYKIIQLF